MQEHCIKIRERMLLLVVGESCESDTIEIQAHVKTCQACNTYFEGLKADHRALIDLAESMQTRVDWVEQQALQQIIESSHSQNRTWIAGLKEQMANSPFRIAVAAVIVVALILGSVLVIVFTEDQPEIVDANGGAEQPTVPLQADTTQDAQAVLAREMEDIRRMFEAVDVDGLIGMLNEGQWESKLTAAGCLAEVGDQRAIESLQKLASAWDGDPEDNPFLQAIEAINKRLSQQTDANEANGIAPPKNTSSTVMATAVAIEPTCTGFIVNESFQPISDAKVILYFNHSEWGWKNRIAAETLSDANGLFAFTEPLEFQRKVSSSSTKNSYIILAVHKDYALGWQSMSRIAEQPSYEIVLTKPTTKSITVTDHNDNPLSDVRVWLFNTGDSKSSNPHLQSDLNLPTDVGLIGATTDSNGVARITNLPRCGTSFWTTYKGYAFGFAFYGQQRIRLSKGASVSGYVLDEDNNPVPDATVMFHANYMHHYFLTSTDEQGHFHIHDLPADGWDKSPWGTSENGDGTYGITVKHDLYMAPQKFIRLFPGSIKDDLVIQCVKSIILKCYVLTVDTNEPMVGALIQGSSEGGRLGGYSDSKGIVTLHVLPGAVSLHFTSPPKGVYLPSRSYPGSTVKLTASGKEMEVVLKAPPIVGGLTNVHGVVLGPDGRPHGGVTVHANAGIFITATSGSHISPTGANDDGQFELKDVPLGRKLHLYTEAKDHSLACMMAFDIPTKTDESFGIELKLEATQKPSMIIKDEDGIPAVDTTLTICPAVGERTYWEAKRTAHTDSKGRLQIDGILPRIEYQIRETQSEKDPQKQPNNHHKKISQTLILIPD